MSRRPRHTHRIERQGGMIRKTYRSWDRGEHRREWQALRLIETHQPGLAPQPVSAELDGDPPSITMTVMPGESVTGWWTDTQLDGLAEAVDRLWSVRPDGLEPTPLHEPGYWHGLAARSRPPADEEARAGYRRATEWIGTSAPRSLRRSDRPVLGQGDPQVGNLLHDVGAGRISLIDFEDAGPSDLCFELANFGEHLGNRGTGLERLFDRFDVDHERLLDCRRLLAAFWVFRLDDPARADERTEQARRLLALFDC